MAKKSNLLSETLMYSINTGGGGEVVTHHLPYARDSANLEKYKKRGFTFEKPVVTEKAVGLLKCRCGFIAKSEFGLAVHQRKHK